MTEAVEHVEGFNNDRQGAEQLSYALRTDPELCTKMATALRAACMNIRDLINDLERLNLDQASNGMNMLLMRLDIHILAGDCSWQDADNDANIVLKSIQLCKRQMFKKEYYTLGDAVYVCTVLRNALSVFEAKTEQLSAICGV